MRSPTQDILLGKVELIYKVKCSSVLNNKFGRIRGKKDIQLKLFCGVGRRLQ